ncbi:APC family permease [Actinomadura rupiterrae]|uniref:APC family permease n=1 Tax=Actinomadura rupiterrae TaxID=559627 RepID=UPI0020A4032E|nr:amino acid permease [Actinomadura rupiterrae]MCP2340725.1 amino acid efflux transporter [Actinomadura rupiterrae]
MTAAQVPAETRPARPAPPRGRLGVGTGTALLTGAVLGPGVLALPHLAAAAAGPSAIIAWAALLVLSAPVALTFASLGVRHPDAGGVASFARRAFGPRTSMAVGWWFFGVVPVGTVAGAMIGGDYVASAAGWGRPGAAAVTLALLAAAFASNHGGLRLSGRVQLALVAALAVLLVVAIGTAIPHVRADAFTPFAPHGAVGVAQAAGVLFFAFAGWEAASHLSADFASGKSSETGTLLRRATVATLGLVGVLYLGLAMTVTGALGSRAETSPVPLTLLLQDGIGQAAKPLTAVAAIALSFVAMNTYIAGGGRLGAALARDGALPRALARGADAGQVPHRSLVVLEVISGAVAAAALAFDLGLDPLMRATSACLAAVTLVGVAAAVRLLPRGRSRALALTATVFVGVVALSCGFYLAIPAAVALAVVLTVRPEPPGA